jgi:hypothetical protein
LESIIEEYLGIEDKKDAFDESAKSSYLIFEKIERFYRGKNLRVDAEVFFDEPINGILGLFWDSSEGTIGVIYKDGLKLSVRSAISNKPWLMAPVFVGAEKLYQQARILKLDAIDIMSDAVELGQAFIDKLEGYHD